MRAEGYQYLLELSKRPGGTLLGRKPIQVDWVPIQEALALDLARRSADADFGVPPTLDIEPQWGDRGANTHIRGMRATTIVGDDRSSSLVVSIDYFRTQAQCAANQFVEAGSLKPGDLFDYRVLALKRQGAAHTPRPSRFTIELVATPVPITPSVLEDFTDRALLFGAGAGDDIPVFVHWDVLAEASVLTRQAGAMETGGILVGHVRRDPGVPEVFLEITAQIPAHARSELTRLSFGPDTWSDVQAAVNLRDGKEVWLGWWHSHSFFKKENETADGRDPPARRPAIPFLSEEDLLLHRTVFPRAYSLALLLTDSPHSGLSWTMFGWRSATMAQRDFHVIHVPLPKAFTPLRGNTHATTR